MITEATDRRLLPDGRILELWTQMYNWKITVTLPENDMISYEDCWCYDTKASAVAAFMVWDGETEPPGWIRNPMTGRRREYDVEGKLLREWVAE